MTTVRHTSPVPAGTAVVIQQDTAVLKYVAVNPESDIAESLSKTVSQHMPYGLKVHEWSVAWAPGCRLKKAPLMIAERHRLVFLCFSSVHKQHEISDRTTIHLSWPPYCLQTAMLM